MRRVWGLIAAVSCLCATGVAQSAYSNCKFGYEVALPSGVTLSQVEDRGFEIAVEEQDGDGRTSMGRVRVTAARDDGRFALWQQNGQLLWTYRVAVEHGRTRFADDWERVGGLLLLEWRDDEATSGHMAHAQPGAPPQLRYAALRREESGEKIVYTFTLTGAAAATPWMRNSVLRRVLAGFHTLPLDEGICDGMKMAAK